MHDVRAYFEVQGDSCRIGSLPLVYVRFQDRLHVDDRRAIECFKALYLNSRAVDGTNRDSVQTDGIGPMRRAGTEHTFLHTRRIAARMHAENIATCTIQPSEQHEFIAFLDRAKSFGNLFPEDEPRTRRALIRLSRGRSRIRKGR